MSAHGSGRPGGVRRAVVFARAPEPGQVKSRLAAELGAGGALAIYRWLGRHTISIVRSIPDCDVVVQHTPPDAGASAAIASWLGIDLALRPQCDGDLGARMVAAVAEATAAGADAVVIVGTDCPALDAAVIERAFRELEETDVVLGPAADGGYYLIAQRRPHPALFEGIPWSSPDTLRATLSAAESAGLRVALLDERVDIDTADDLRRWLERGGAGPDEVTRVLGRGRPTGASVD